MIWNELRKLKNSFLWKAYESAIDRMPPYLLLVAAQKRRIVLSREIDQTLKSTVSYGPFQGLRLSPDPWWGESDRASILLGLYEQEVLTELVAVSEGFKTFVDVGAADGYYAIGALFAGLFDRALCFEASQRGRDTILSNADLNQVEERVTVLGEADRNLHRVIHEQGFEKSLILIDIEGAELDLLNDDTFSALPQSAFIIETHSWVPDAQAKITRLCEIAGRHRRVSALTTSSRDLSGIAELKEFHDTDRWLVCSEGRQHLTTWLCVGPCSTTS